MIQSVKHRSPTSGGEGDAFCSPILQVRKPLDSAHSLKVVHQLAHCLSGNA
jgi:hypothetical protein